MIVPILIFLAALIPCAAAFIFSFKARSPLARHILRWSGLFFVLMLLFLGLIVVRCEGDILKAVTACSPPAMTHLVQSMRSSLMGSLAAYVVIGPVLLTCAALLEWRHIRQYPKG